MFAWCLYVFLHKIIYAYIYTRVRQLQQAFCNINFVWFTVLYMIIKRAIANITLFTYGAIILLTTIVLEYLFIIEVSINKHNYRISMSTCHCSQSMICIPTVENRNGIVNLGVVDSPSSFMRFEFFSITSRVTNYLQATSNTARAT